MYIFIYCLDSLLCDNDGEIYSPHKQDMSRITYISVGKKAKDERHGKDGKYITVSKEGRVCFWKSDLTLQRSELVRLTMYTKTYTVYVLCST